MQQQQLNKQTGEPSETVSAASFSERGRTLLRGCLLAAGGRWGSPARPCVTHRLPGPRGAPCLPQPARAGGFQGPGPRDGASFSSGWTRALGQNWWGRATGWAASGSEGFGIEGSLAKDRRVCLQTCPRHACAGVLTGSPVPASSAVLRPSPTPSSRCSATRPFRGRGGHWLLSPPSTSRWRPPRSNGTALCLLAALG